MTNKTWTVTSTVTREQVVGGFYRYYTPVGPVLAVGETGRWRLHYDNGWTTPLKTLEDCDAVVRSWMADLEELGIPALLAQG